MNKYHCWATRRDFDAIIEARTPGQAKYEFLKQLKEAGYNVSFLQIRVRKL